MSEFTITIKAAGDKKYQITVTPSTTVLELKEKLALEFDAPADTQRLIFSGKVLKDGDTLETYKIKEGHTIHLVKGPKKASSTSASSTNNNSATSSASTATPSAIPNNIASGQGSFNPLAGLTGARYAGYNVPMPTMDQLGFGTDGLPSENQMDQMMDNPMFQEGMRSMLSDPQMLDYLIQQSPQLSAMGPAARQLFQSDYVRNMLTNPQALRSMMQFQRSMSGGNPGGPASNFPAPGNPSDLATTTPPTNTTPTTTNNSSTATNSNPFASLFGTGSPFGTGTGTGAGAGAGSNEGTGDSSAFPPNPFLNPAMMSLLGGAGAGTGAGPFGAAAAIPQADTRPPEEVYESQLRQLTDMGFFDFDRNIKALRRSGGSVEGAVEALLNGTV